jgi:hypothetical protein
MSDLVSYLVDQVAALKRAVSGMAFWRWGVVTGVAPLQIRLDADADPLPDAPDTLVGGLRVGDRVRVVLVARRPLVLGRAGGPAQQVMPLSVRWGESSDLPVVVSGSAVDTTNSTGDWRISHDLHLVGVSSIQVTSGDSGAQNGALSIRNKDGDITADSFVVHTPTANRLTRCDWILVGWI